MIKVENEKFLIFVLLTVCIDKEPFLSAVHV
jgi:hypothetical protein